MPGRNVDAEILQEEVLHNGYTKTHRAMQGPQLSRDWLVGGA